MNSGGEYKRSKATLNLAIASNKFVSSFTCQSKFYIFSKYYYFKSPTTYTLNFMQKVIVKEI